MDHSTPFLNQSSLGFEGSRSVPLGIVTKTTSPLTATGVSASEFIDYETGEIKPNNPQFLTESELKRSARANRWGLKSVVNTLLPESRTSKCMVLRAPIVGGGLADIDVCRGAENKKAFYHGLMACGSIWNCPVCAAKIAERRRQELKSALSAANQLDLRAHFVTLTFPHGISDDLNDILSKMSQAFKRLSTGKYRVKKQLADILPDSSIQGFIRAIEVTHGRNGFHPHIHMIVFTDEGVRSGHLKMVYGDAWQRSCRLAGLPVPSWDHGCTVQDGSYAAEYASKWGIEDEMTKSNSKQTRQKGVTPWGLLRCVLDGDDEDYSSKRASDLFRVYSKAFTGRRQLYWSNGLRKRLDLSNEVSDEELAEKPDEERATVLATLTVEQWKAIRKAKAQAVLLDIAESAPDSFHQFLSNFSSENKPDHQNEPSHFVDRSVAKVSIDSMVSEAFERLEDYRNSPDYFNAVLSRQRGRVKPERMTNSLGYANRRSLL